MLSYLRSVGINGSFFGIGAGEDFKMERLEFVVEALVESITSSRLAADPVDLATFVNDLVGLGITHEAATTILRTIQIFNESFETSIGYSVENTYTVKSIVTEFLAESVKILSRDTGNADSDSP